MLKEQNGKLLVLLSLYMAQSIPMSFFSTVVPVIMRQQHYSLEAIGLMQLIKLPWIIKFLWAPLVDRTDGSTAGYRRWIFYSEIFYAFSVASVAFFSLEQQFPVIIILMVLAITASATQDIATDAWAILTLKTEERSLGNSMQSMGSFLGSMIGSGVLLVVYHYLGWTWLLLALSVVVLIALIPLGLFRPAAMIRKRPRSKSVSFKDIGSFFGQKGIWLHLLMIGIFQSGLVGIMTMVKPLMIDLGYDVKDIGVISGLAGTGAGALMALAAGMVMRRLSRRTSAILFASVNLLPVAFFVLMHAWMNTLAILVAGVVMVWGAYAMGMVLVFTLAMDRVRHCREGTDFTMQIVIVHLFNLLVAIGSGQVAGTFSYGTLFYVSLMLGLVTLWVVWGRQDGGSAESRA